MWSKKENCCLSCGSTVWKHQAKGFCQKCYPIKKRIDKVMAWDQDNSSTWNIIPGFGVSYFESFESVRFNRVKREILRQLESRLRIIKNSVNPENVVATSIEYSLDELAEIVLKDKGKKLFHYHAANYEQFSNAQLKIIFKDLNYLLLKKRFSLDLVKILTN